MLTSVAYAMATPPAQGAQQGGSALMSLIPIALMLVVFYFLLIRPQQKRAKEVQQMLANIKRGDKVLMTSGIYGTIESVHDDYFKINIGDAVIKTTKSAVNTVLHIETAEK